MLSYLIFLLFIIYNFRILILIVGMEFIYLKVLIVFFILKYYFLKGIFGVLREGKKL